MEKNIILDEYKKGNIGVRLIGRPINEDFELISESFLIRRKIKKASLEEKKEKYKDFVKDLSLYDSCEKYKCLLFFEKERRFGLFKNKKLDIYSES